MPTVHELLEIVKVELANLLPGKVFLVRDLFKEYEWNQISCNDRLVLGTLFLNYIDNIVIIPIEKTLSGQQRYYLTYCVDV